MEAAGRYRIFGIFVAWDCRTQEQVNVTDWIDVVPGPVPANLRHAPRARLRETEGTQQESGPGRRFTAEAFDPDGFVQGARFHWGDGKGHTDVAAHSVAPCERHPMRRLSRSSEDVPQPIWANHEFVGPGRFVVRVTVTTTGCRGENPQTAEAEWVVEMP